MATNVNTPAPATFAAIFGAKAAQATATTETRPEAQFWINLGYTVDTINDETNEPEVVFVSLRQGIALDSINDWDLKSVRAPKMKALRTSQNELRSQLVEAAETLQPGGSMLICNDASTGLAVEIRRIKDAAAPLAEGENTLSRKLNLAA